MNTVVSAVYRRIFAFLSKSYWEQQDDYGEDIEAFFSGLRNHEEVFDVEPQSQVTLYEDEWFGPNSVDDTIDELEDEDDMETTYICNWRDDAGHEFFTLLKKEAPDWDVVCVTRSSPVGSLDENAEQFIDQQWRPLCLKMESGDRMYVWESPQQSSFEFMELYRKWVTQYTDTEDEDDHEVDPRVEDLLRTHDGIGGETTTDSGYLTTTH